MNRTIARLLTSTVATGALLFTGMAAAYGSDHTPRVDHHDISITTDGPLGASLSLNDPSNSINILGLRLCCLNLRIGL